MRVDTVATEPNMSLARMATVIAMAAVIIALGAGTPASANLGQARADPPEFRFARTLTIELLTIHDVESLPSWTPATPPDARKLLAVFAKGQPSIVESLDPILPMSTYIQMFVRLDDKPDPIVVNLPLPVAHDREPYRFSALIPLASRVGLPIFTLSFRDAEELAAIVRALVTQKPSPEGAAPREGRLW